MGWKDLLHQDGEERILPWTGGRSITDGTRTWNVKGRIPREHGWFTFKVSGGRKATCEGPADAPYDYDVDRQVFRGYLVGDRIIHDHLKVAPDPNQLLQQTEPVFLVEPGLELFSRALVVWEGDRLIYLREEFPLGPEPEVLAAYQDQKDSVTDIPEVTPTLDLAFRWMTLQREKAQERRKEQERLRLEEEARLDREHQMKEARKNLGTAVGRRALAEVDFEAAAKAALMLTGAELLATRPSHQKGEMVVQYRFQGRRLECVVDHKTLQVLDAGVCLVDHDTGETGDRRFTLESLPPVICEAIKADKLVVWRHV